MLPPETTRIRSFPTSAMYRLKEPSRATPFGPFNVAEVAAPPSPEKFAVPFPATVLIVYCCAQVAVETAAQSEITITIWIRIRERPRASPKQNVFMFPFGRSDINSSSTQASPSWRHHRTLQRNALEDLFTP